MKIFLFLGFIVTQASYANPDWNLSPKTEQALSKALAVSSSFQAQQLNRGSASFVTVGGDSTCDFRVGSNKIQNAINSGASEIRIASNDVYQEFITINDPLVNLSIRGGFSSCTAAESNNQSNQQQDWTEITRPNGQSGSIFTITGLLSHNMTTFENIKVVVGDGQGLTTGGGIAVVNTDSDVILQNTWLTEGSNIVYGGGLLVQSSNVTVILNNTTISNNQTISSGGGIYCNDFSGMNKFATIVVNTGSSISLNQTEGNGGGAFLFRQCLLASFAGSANPFNIPNNIHNTKSIEGSIADIQGINLNQAESSGGGVYLNSGASLLIHGTQLCNLSNHCFGDKNNPANMMENTANSNGIVPSSFAGGAIYATGTNTDVTISAAWFNANAATQSSGGAIALFDHANLTINRNGIDCWDSVNCNLFKANRADFTGGFLYNNDATANISHAIIQGSNANLGVAVYNSNNGVTNIDTSIFHSNGGSSGFLSSHLFIGNTGADYAFKYATIADNDTEIGIFKIEDDPGTVLLLNSSIIDDVTSGPVLAFGLGGSGFIGAFCVMAHEISSLSGASNTVDDPEFFDRANQDYHLSNTSPAIDYCSVLTTPTNKDMDFQSYGWDNPNLSNFMGAFDIGADENFSKNYFTIGTDATCDFNSTTQTIQDVIDTGVGEVRIARNGFYDSAIIINDESVKLRGGFLDCTAADANNATTHTTIDAPGGIAVPTIDIQGTSLGNSILIEGLTIAGVDSNFSAISANGSVADITLNDVFLTGHNIDEFNFGGAINLTDGAINLTLIDTLVMQNSAHRGGGIYCEGASSKIVVQGESGISHNTAQGQGGGVYLTNGCDFTIYSGENNPDASTNLGISDNLAYNEGGGIYADLGSQVTLYGHELCDTTSCVGNNTSPVNINNNTSGFTGSPSIDDRGAGIYASGQSTSVNIYASLFKNNLSKFGGSAIYINDLASLNVSRLSKDCWDSTKCNYFLNNTSTLSNGTIESFQGQLNISSSYFEDNTGSAISVVSSFARIEGSVFNNNNAAALSDVSVIIASISATVEIIHSTFADNFIENSSTLDVSFNSQLSLYSSIVNDPLGVVLATTTGTVNINCAMTHESLSILGTNIIVADPSFVDRNNRDYHIAANSQAKDMCDDSVIQARFKDIDFEKRGLDDPMFPNFTGSFDVGADEAFVEMVFANGFE